MKLTWSYIRNIISNLYIKIKDTLSRFTIVKFFIYILYLISFILLTFSILLFFVALKEAIPFFHWSHSGINEFLSYFLINKEIYASTIVLITIIVTIKQYQYSRKLARKETWSNIFTSKVKELREENPVIYEYCMLNIEELFENSEKLQRKFKTEMQLRNFLLEMIEPWIEKIEIASENYKLYKALYPKENYTHSDETFFEILIYIAQPYKSFKENFVFKYKEIYAEIASKKMKNAREIDLTKFNERAQFLEDIKTLG